MTNRLLETIKSIISTVALMALFPFIAGTSLWLSYFMTTHVFDLPLASFVGALAWFVSCTVLLILGLVFCLIIGIILAPYKTESIVKEVFG